MVLLVLSAFFSATETAITSLSRIKVKGLVERKVRGAKLLSKLKEKPGDFLSTILIGNNLANTGAAALATSVTISFFEQHGMVNISYAVGIATGIMTFLLLVFGEITPKTIAIHNAELISLFVAPVIYVLKIVFQPIALLTNLFSRPLIYIFGGGKIGKGGFLTEEEIAMVLAEGQKEGLIEEEERAMITSIFEFGDTIAREVMTPRPDVIACDVEKQLKELTRLIIDSGHSRIPVYEGTMDNVIGVIYAKDLLKKHKAATIREMMHQPFIIPESKKVTELLHEMQAARTHLAIIVDEYGITSGIVTMEDLVEEIVGEIHDEFEREEKRYEPVEDGAAIIDGKLSIDDLNGKLGVDIPEGDYDTVGGFVFSQLGKAPSVGDVVHYENLLISVERVHRRRIARVKIVKFPDKLAEEGVGG
ncbi:MAG: hemolysin family protein [Candidatus Margulisbacteria bacterium]|nr:hemolysin family protein [Candidatus Margulisiibacteriota bacterium]